MCVWINQLCRPNWAPWQTKAGLRPRCSPPSSILIFLCGCFFSLPSTLLFVCSLLLPSSPPLPVSLPQAHDLCFSPSPPPSSVSGDGPSGLAAICCLFCVCMWLVLFFFYEAEIRWHLIDRHGLHGYQGDRVVGKRDTCSGLGLSDSSWEE